MIPQLYTADAVGRPLTRIGGIHQATRCDVVQEINGAWTLELEAPVGCDHFARIAQGNVIEARVDPTAGRVQPFLIKDVQRALSGRAVSVQAEHISYHYNNVMLAPFLNGGVRRSAQWAWSTWISAAANNVQAQQLYRATIAETGAPHVLTPMSARAYMMEQLVPAYGGELLFDGLNVSWVDSIGQDRGARIVYASNMVSCDAAYQDQEIVTAIYPYYGSQGDENRPFVELPEKVLNVGIQAPFQRVLPVDLSGEFEQTPTEAQLRTAAQAWIAANRKSALPPSITVEAVDLPGSVPIYTGDVVTVYFQAFGISEARKVQSTTYDVLRERTSSITVGAKRQTFVKTILNLVR